jgi:hypothetical protein
MRIYVASSWRNTIQPHVVEVLRAEGHEVYDFKNPKPGDEGFHWSEIDPGWKGWSPGEFRKALEHPIAIAGFEQDMSALRACDACLLVLPCGRSAHDELGWACGAGKKTAVYIPGTFEGPPFEPELMYKMHDAILTSIVEVVSWAMVTSDILVQEKPRGMISCGCRGAK